MDKEKKIVLCRENEFPFEFLDNLLKARIELGHETGKRPHDQEINVYIAGLLSSINNPKKMNELSSYVSGEKDLNVLISEASEHDNRYRYNLFKTNGDNILMRLGVFDNPHVEKDKPTRYAKEVIPYKQKEEGMKQTGRILYSMAAETLIHIKGKTALFFVFEQFYEDGLDRYVELLRHVYRKCGLDMHDKTAVDEMTSSEICDDSAHKKRLFALYQDNILKTYSDYIKSKDPQLKERMLEIERNMQTIKPDFRFKFIE